MTTEYDLTHGDVDEVVSDIEDRCPSESWSTPQKSKTMTKDIQDYIEIDLGQDMRHDPEMLLEATQETADTFELDEWKVLRFMLANEPMFDT